MLREMRETKETERRNQGKGWGLNKMVRGWLLEKVTCEQRLQQDEGRDHAKTCAKARGRNELGERITEESTCQSQVQGQQRETQPEKGARNTQASCSPSWSADQQHRHLDACWRGSLNVETEGPAKPCKNFGFY